MDKLKTYKLFEEISLKVNSIDTDTESTNNIINQHVGIPSNDVNVNDRIKEIIDSIIKIKHYFRMLCDTTEHVFDVANKKIPKSSKFIAEIYKRDDILGDLMDELYLSFNDGNAIIFDIEEICETIDKLEEYTGGGNLDILLNKKNELIQEDEDDEDDEDDTPDESNEKDI